MMKRRRNRGGRALRRAAQREELTYFSRREKDTFARKIRERGDGKGGENLPLQGKKLTLFTGGGFQKGGGGVRGGKKKKKHETPGGGNYFTYSPEQASDLTD